MGFLEGFWTGETKASRAKLAEVIARQEASAARMKRDEEASEARRRRSLELGLHVPGPNPLVDRHHAFKDHEEVDDPLCREGLHWPVTYGFCYYCVKRNAPPNPVKLLHG